jgi:hypothetical protein
MVKKASSGKVTLLAGADVGPVVKPVEQFAERIIPVLREADIRFAQCERTYSKRGWSPRFAMGPGGQHSRLAPEMASIFKSTGIDVASMASNHTMDWGPEALLDTIDLLRGMGVQTIGAGKNDEEARSPVILERKGIKVAFLAYCSVIRDGQAAGQDKAGIAPLRVHTCYEAEDFQPGTPPKIITFAYEEDLNRLQEDIRKVKSRADVVVVSLHWGVRYVPKVIATYQPPVAHAAIDAGADLILGHHSHLLKAVEVYKGKVCFYSMCNFLTTGGLQKRLPYLWNLFWYQEDPQAPLYGFPIDSRKTMIVKAVFSKKGVEKVSFLPAYVNNQAQPEILASRDERFQEILRYMEWVSDQFPHTFKVEGNEIVVKTSAPKKT